MEKKKIRTSFLFLILLLAFILRFYRLNLRWTIDSDPARDIMVAKSAIELKKFPLIGPFSSAGPFVSGPLYWWPLMFSYLIAPHFIGAPFFLYALIDLFFVFIMARIGFQLWQNKGLLVLGLISAVSSAQIYRSATVNQPTLVSFFGALMILAFLKYFQKQKPVFSFLAGLCLGSAISSHLQALNLTAFGLFILLTPKIKWQKKLLALLFFAFGAVIPLLPLFYWDYGQKWHNILNILDYFLIGQYRIYVPNRWLTYLGQDWPKLWSAVFGGVNILGGPIFFGYFFIAASALIFVFHWLKKKLKPELFILASAFAVMLVLNRYYRGERFEGYLLYFYPLIMIFTAYSLIGLNSIKKIGGKISILIFGLALLLTLKADLQLIKFQLRPDTPKSIIQKKVSALKQQKPGKKFIVFDDRLQNAAPGLGMSAFLYFEGLIDEKKGEIIGFSTDKQLKIPKLNHIEGIAETVYIYDLSSTWLKKDFEKKNWINISPYYVCHDILEWWKVKEFQSSFCFSCFLKEKLGFH